MKWSQRLAAAREQVPLAMVALLVFIVLIALTGGTSRPDSLSQALVRAISVVMIAGWAIAAPRLRGRELLPGFAFLAALALLMLVQLTPLPPDVWSGLAGRDFYRESAAAAGMAQPWRPIALVPDRGWSSLFVLLVPLATLVGLAQLGSRRRTQLLLPLGLLALVSAVLGLAQLSGGQSSPLRVYEYSSDSYASGFFANRNHQALLLACALPVLAAWATIPKLQPGAARLRGFAALGIGVFILLMLPTTGSRAGLVLAGVGAVAALVIAAPDLIAAYRRLSRRRRRQLRWFVLAGAVAFVCVAIFFGRNESLHRLYGLDARQDLRARTLPVVMQMLGTFFPAGTGFGGFDAVYRRFEPFDQLSHYYLNQAHNDLLQIVIEGGVVGAALLGAVFLWWLWASWRAWRAEPSAERQAARAASIVFGMAFLASAVDYPLRTPLMMVVMTIAGAWLLVPARRVADA